MNNLRSERKKKRRLRKGVKAFLWFTGILTLAILAYSGYLYFKVNSMLSDSFLMMAGKIGITGRTCGSSEG